MLRNLCVVVLRGVGSSLLLVSLCNWGCGGQSNQQAPDKDCRVGTLGCPCYGNDTGNRGFDCSGEICVESAGQPAAGPAIGSGGVAGDSQASPEASAQGSQHNTSTIAPSGTGRSQVLLSSAGGNSANVGAISTGGAMVRTNGSAAAGGITSIVGPTIVPRAGATGGIATGSVTTASGGTTGCGKTSWVGKIYAEVDAGPYCGDGILQPPFEQCDEGKETTTCDANCMRR